MVLCEVFCHIAEQRGAPEGDAGHEVLIAVVTHGFVKSTLLYLSLSLLICILVCGVEVTDVKNAVANPTSFGDWFLFSGFWALPLLFVNIVFDAVGNVLKRRFSKRYRSLGMGVGELVLGRLRVALLGPFGGLRAIGMNRRYNDLTGMLGFMSKAGSIFWFCWSIALFAYLALGFIAVS